MTFTEAGGVDYSGDCGAFQLGDAGADGTIAKIIWNGHFEVDIPSDHRVTTAWKIIDNQYFMKARLKGKESEISIHKWFLKDARCRYSNRSRVIDEAAQKIVAEKFNETVRARRELEQLANGTFAEDVDEGGGGCQVKENDMLYETTAKRSRRGPPAGGEAHDV